MKYEVVMGLEVHVELSTQSKLFCSCSAGFGSDANENVCPACAGMPGIPPVVNKKAVELGIAAGLVTNCEITPVMTFDKKNYYYPDLPTGYQITQWFAPICTNGWIEIETPESPGDKTDAQSPPSDAVSPPSGEKNTKPGCKRITLQRIHLEEDAGKLVHDPRTRSSLVDFNRASVPLVEIVSNPDFRSAEEVIAYLEKLRSLLSFAGVSDCKMQEGSMRCDVNISVRETGCSVLGTRTEIKNMNSLKAIKRAIGYESQRHIDALETGCETLVQETRRWDDDCGETFSMREKEEAADYRYFPNPELMPVHIDKAWIESVRSALPEPAHVKYEHMTSKLGLPEYDSRLITGSRNLTRIFDETLTHFENPKEISNWIIGDLLAAAKTSGKSDDEIDIDCEKFAKVIKLVDDKTINRATGKKLFIKVIEEGIDPEAFVSENALAMVSDSGLLETAIREVLSENEKSVLDYRAGKQKAFGFLVGQVMKKMAGKADPSAVNEILKKILES